MMKTVALSALAAIAIVTAGIAGAASTSSAPADPSPGMMGPGGMDGRFGMMGHGGRFGGFMGGGMMSCMHERRGDGDRADGARPPMKRSDLEACLTKTFNEMDANHDGKVTLAEARAWREAQKVKREEAVFKRFDTNGDGGISKDESVGKALSRFDAADTNRDGVISPDEAKAARQAMMQKWKDHKPADGAN